MTAYQFMLEMELYPYSKENFELTKLVNQIELQEMALNARDAIKYNDLNEEALAYISETVEAANLKVEYFSEGKDDESKSDSALGRLGDNIVKFWKWIWTSIANMFAKFANWLGKLVDKNYGEDGPVANVQTQAAELSTVLKSGEINPDQLGEEVTTQMSEFTRAFSSIAGAVGGALGGLAVNGNPEEANSPKAIFNNFCECVENIGENTIPFNFDIAKYSAKLNEVRELLKGDDIDKAINKNADSKIFKSLAEDIDGKVVKLQKIRNKVSSIKFTDIGIKVQSLKTSAEEIAKKAKEMEDAANDIVAKTNDIDAKISIEGSRGEKQNAIDSNARVAAKIQASKDAHNAKFSGNKKKVQKKRDAYIDEEMDEYEKSLRADHVFSNARDAREARAANAERGKHAAVLATSLKNLNAELAKDTNLVMKDLVGFDTFVSAANKRLSGITSLVKTLTMK